MKRIYFILTYSGTILAKIIKIYTGNEFAHVSIALDENLNQMYSFGRLKPYNPFVGGFVHEGIHIGTFKRFYKTQTAVYSILISDEQFEKIRKIIKQIERCPVSYKFNIIGLFGAGFNIRIHRRHAFYCAEFIRYLLLKAKVRNNLPEIVKPEDFKKLENIRLEYRGMLRTYQANKKQVNSMVS